MTSPTFERRRKTRRELQHQPLQRLSGALRALPAPPDAGRVSPEETWQTLLMRQARRQTGKL